MMKPTCPIVRAAAPTLLLLWMLSRPGCLGAAPSGANPSAAVIDYEEPKLLVGEIFTIAPAPKKLLFKSVRTATRSGATVKVFCEYTSPDGSLAARDSIVYEAGRLVSSQTDLFQTGESGRAVIQSDPANPGRQKVFYDYTTGRGKKTSASHSLENDTLIDDMLPAFIHSHWDALMQGSAVKFRYIVLSRKETVGFKLVKESETTWQGTPVVRLRMEPTSIIIARLVAPVFFLVEKNGAHRTFEYIGRTTPLVKDGNKWKNLDADTVFQWK